MDLTETQRKNNNYFCAQKSASVEQGARVSLVTGPDMGKLLLFLIFHVALRLKVLHSNSSLRLE